MVRLAAARGMELPTRGGHGRDTGRADRPAFRMATAKAHVSRLLAKLRAGNRVQIALLV